MVSTIKNRSGNKIHWLQKQTVLYAIMFDTLLFCFGLCISSVSFAQIQHGGAPIDVTQTKRLSKSEKIIMPALEMIQKSAVTDDVDYMQKSLKFAHTFQVCIEPGNSGSWFETDTYRIWQVDIESEGAYSLNLVFSKYYLPAGARLFVFDEGKKLVLGAFTSANNKPFKMLGVYPIPGEKIIVQYEEPKNASFPGELEIGEVNHDFKDVFGILNRWTRRASGTCNVNVNCETESKLEYEKRSVMRIFAGDELGTGTLLNNTNRDGKAYVISALHVYDDAKGAQTAVFDFNYESPFCTNLEGFDMQTISGAKTVAVFDSLDLMLIELSSMPPAHYKPYWAGWDARAIPPKESYCIHHPNGDTKKISYDSGECDSIRYSNNYINYGSWKMFNWEYGTTEQGSSGAGLFNQSGKLVGILQGGVASCINNDYDLFTRFDKLFDHRSESQKHLKTWLDPLKTEVRLLDGFDYYNNKGEGCISVSNFIIEDTHVVIKEGYSNFYTGNNSLDITEVAEKFTMLKSGALTGIALGVSDVKAGSLNSEIAIRIYSGNELPQFALKQLKFPYSQLLPNAMNYLSFDQPVNVEGNFFVSVVLPSSNDTLSVFQSAHRYVAYPNSIYYKKSGTWMQSSDAFQKSNTNAALLIEALVCRAELTEIEDTVVANEVIAMIYPVPASTYVTLEFNGRISKCDAKVFDLQGRVVLNETIEQRRFESLDVSKLKAGMYILKLLQDTKEQVKRIVIYR
jgi:lysyl endopeptidase